MPGVEFGTTEAHGRGSSEPTSYVPVLELASGGMGTVSVCVRRSGAFERLYAIKRLHPHLQGDPSMRSMFLDEARMSGLLRHSNVVPVLDVGEDETGPFLVMDYVEGVSVSRFIRHHAKQGDRIPVPLCLHIVAQTARGLHAAHELEDSDGHALQLVHRDVSPQNILIARDGVVRVTDFGVAKALGRSTHTSTGLLKGKVGYMSPEQLRFEPIDRRCDLFALGVVLAELLTASRMFPGKDAAAVARRVLNEPPPDLGDLRSEVSPAVVELAFELLAKDPAQRPSTAAEVASRIEEELALEGPVDLASYVEAHFAEELDRTRVAVRDAATAEPSQPEGAAHGVTVVPATPPPRSAKWGVLAAAATAAVLTGVWWLNRPPATEPVADTPPAVTADPGSVDVFIESRPTGAIVRVDGRELGTTPLSVPMPRQDQPVELRLELEGHLGATQSIAPTEDTRLLVALTPAPQAAAPEVNEPPPPVKRRPVSKRRRKPSAEPKPETDKPVFRRFD